MGLSKQQFTMVAVLLAGAMLVVLNQTLLSPAFPAIMSDLQVDATTVQWLTSGYALMEAIVIPLSAYLIGRFSTRQLFIGAMLLFGVGSLVAALAPVFGVLLLGRVLQACATGVMMPMAFTLILLIFPRDKRGAAMGIVGLVISFAPAVGPSASGVLVDSVGWRALFLIVVALTLVVVFVGAFCLENKEGFEKASFDVLSVVLSSLGMLSLLYGFSTFTSAENHVVTAVLVALGALLLTLFVRRQLKLDVPLLKVEVLKVRNFRIGVCLIALLQASLVGLGVVLPIYVQNVLGQSATVTGLIMLPGAVIGALCGFFAGKIFDKFGVRKIVLVGGTVMAASGVGMALLGPATIVPVVTCVYTFLIIGLQFLITPLGTWGVNSLDNRVIQHGNALSNTTNQVGGSFGTALIVSLTALPAFFAPQATGVEALYLGNHYAFIGMAVMLLVVFACIVLFVKDKAAENQPAAVVDEYGRSEGEYLVCSTMNPNPAFVHNSATVRDAVSVFAKTETSGIPILTEDRKLCGFISDGDVMRYLGDLDETLGSALGVYRLFDDERLQDRARDLMDLNVMEIATRKVISVNSGDKLSAACKVLSDKKLKKLPVLENGMLVGTLSRRNVIKALNDAVDPKMA